MTNPKVTTKEISETEEVTYEANDIFGYVV